jgi:hypothetical protein
MTLITNAAFHAHQVEVAIAEMAKVVLRTRSVVKMGRMPYLHHLSHQFQKLHQTLFTAVNRMMMQL